ncbi:hypothetical protein DP939_37670 [Spongiactinospora rosea]|uniref:Uncharacterized protein n=1 Tax=Spongiactinospora rosea TaxID=2248750 RepID=A0A366LP42_9ACTN|nr:hypothetical protein [Spongiactinospora rosea]RBQ14922.1 hypothetical protein DP939_37670 [Spongiactinospora rosea]
MPELPVDPAPGALEDPRRAGRRRAGHRLHARAGVINSCGGELGTLNIALTKGVGVNLCLPP